MSRPYKGYQFLRKPTGMYYLLNRDTRLIVRAGWNVQALVKTVTPFSTEGFMASNAKN